jgi:hypothetical protein
MASAASCGSAAAAGEPRAEEGGDALAELAGGADPLDAGVDQRHAVGVGAVDAVAAEDGAFDGHRGVAAG